MLKLGANLFINYEEIVAIMLFAIGLCMLVFEKNLLKKAIGMNIMDTGSFLLLASIGYIDGRIAPIIINSDTNPELYINPVPSGLVLTGIVVSVSVTAITLSLIIRLYERYHTLNLDEIYMREKEEKRK